MQSVETRSGGRQVAVLGWPQLVSGGCHPSQIYELLNVPDVAAELKLTADDPQLDRPN